MLETEVGVRWRKWNYELCCDGWVGRGKLSSKRGGNDANCTEYLNEMMIGMWTFRDRSRPIVEMNVVVINWMQFIVPSCWSLRTTIMGQKLSDIKLWIIFEANDEDANLTVQMTSREMYTFFWHFFVIVHAIFCRSRSRFDRPDCTWVSEQEDLVDVGINIYYINVIFLTLAQHFTSISLFVWKCF